MAITHDFAGTGALSGDWTKEISGSNDVARESGIAKIDTSYDSDYYIYVWNAASSPDDGYSQIAVTGGTTTYAVIGCAYRFTTDSSGDGYSVEYGMAATGDGIIYRYDTSSPTLIDWEDTNDANGDSTATFKLDCTGSAIKGYVDSVENNAATDSNHASGNAGFYYKNSENQADATEIDSFEASSAAGGIGDTITLNIGDDWKAVTEMQINIGDTWKNVVAVQQNIGDVWKDVFTA